MKEKAYGSTIVTGQYGDSSVAASITGGRQAHDPLVARDLYSSASDGLVRLGGYLGCLKESS